VRAVVTGPKFLKLGSKEFQDFVCVSSFRNDERFAFILHYAIPELLPWTNVFPATNAAAVRKRSPRAFTPSEMPVSRAPPECGKPPVFVAQGSMGRRLVEQLTWLLESGDLGRGGGAGGKSSGSRDDFTLRILTRSGLDGIVKDHKKAQIRKHIDHRQNLGMLDYAEAPLGAAFMLPLISPDFKGTSHYFHGHPTSNIAFAVNYGLHVVGRWELAATYAEDLKCLAGHYHGNDTKASFLGAARDAVAAFHRWCGEGESEEGRKRRGPWASFGLARRRGC
jgi:hypothetical protein